MARFFLRGSWRSRKSVWQAAKFPPASIEQLPSSTSVRKQCLVSACRRARAGRGETIVVCVVAQGAHGSRVGTWRGMAGSAKWWFVEALESK